ncbi:beta-galactosidase [Paenibacillus sacheonensis]|uniref:Beta-galactosidase n=1 Tax=Paenibacillus sacheonensis TaxID=742054 RepID=A0A7X5BZ67_9BACL|nr:beta-galactosidase [Paenibacillus sacheonensis]MBM7568538.1 beta-galactosidase [Paenibacillus sacheonensis]NBC72363.1 cellulase family glycosylhydrolase [Paenibacillus sacheonensis]
MSKSFRTDAFMLGVCYYPEHWEETLWEDDFRRMREMDMSVIRVGEFAWTIFEPVEGEFRFDLFERALDAAHRHGLQVIMGTPTATPPAWLTEKYPEVLNVSQKGVTYRHGMRRHYNYNSPIYRDLCERITRKMAERFANHPAVIGWQLDNEFNCETSVFYSDADHAAFREWAKAKYETLDRLNKAWGTVVWSQTYTNWSQVYLPRATVNDSPNPHHALDEKRFISDSVISFAKVQADVLRELCPNHWVTTNGLFGHLDSHQLTDELLDFFSYDSYPLFAVAYPDGGDNPLLDRRWSSSLSAIRSISPLFCIMEQQSGPGGWVNRMKLPAPKPGQMRLWTYQSILHGADMILYFRWRTATMGTEIYWHGINDYHNQDNRRVAEATRVGHELAAVGQQLTGASFLAEAAIIRDYENEWDGEFDHWQGPLSGQSGNAWFKAFQFRHIPVDIIYMRRKTTLADLAKYKVLVYPHAAIMSDDTAALLEAYVAGGGTLILGSRTGFKDETGQCRMMPFPGPVASLCGITVEDFTVIADSGTPPDIAFAEGYGQEDAKYTALLFNEILRPEDPSVETVAVYDGDYYAGKPAMTRRPYGQGEVWYYGAAFNDAAADAVLEKLPIATPADWIDAPRQVELGLRDKNGELLAFLLNYGSTPATVAVHKEVVNLLGDGPVDGKLVLEPYGVAILKLADN